MTLHPKQTTRRKALGKGLGALLPDNTEPDPVSTPPLSSSGDTITYISVSSIDPNPEQPRHLFDQKALQELAVSIKEDGVLQPVTVKPAGDRFTLIIGERRLKATSIAGLTKIPAIIREIEDDKILGVSLVENIQREDLNPMEIAQTLERMVKELNLNHDELAAHTGKSRSNITNHIRLLKLSARVKEFVRRGELQMGHARCLLSLEDSRQQDTFAEIAVKQQLSVRQVERLVAKTKKKEHPTRKQELDPNVAAAVEEMQRVLQTPVRIRMRRKKWTGTLEIDYSSQEELTALGDRILGEGM